MHWIDCGKSKTNIHLLNLANHPVGSEKSKCVAGQTNLLDRICEYLDMHSLHSLSEMSEQSQHLVNSYVKKRSKKHGKFTLSDEFKSFDWIADCYDIFETFSFTRFITDLNVYSFRCDCESKSNISYHIRKMVFLDKVSIYDDHPQERWPENLSGISHLVYDSSHFMGYSDLVHLIERFPDAETIEFKKSGNFGGFKPDDGHTPIRPNLKEFVFNYRGGTQVKNLKEIFKHTNTKLIPVFLNTI